MAVSTRITEPDGIYLGRRGDIYKQRSAVCGILTIMKTDGRCRLEGDGRTNRPFRREAPDFEGSE